MGSAIVLQCLLLVCVASSMSGVAFGSECFDSSKKVYYSCPTEDDKFDEIYCCGEFENQRCCNMGEHSREGTVITHGVAATIGLIFLVSIITAITLCCCCCCQCCLLYKIRERRRQAVTMTPMQPMVSVQPRDEAGRPVYPVQQQYYPVPQQGYPPQQPSQYPAESFPQSGQPNYGKPDGPYPTKQLAEEQSLTSNQPFTYGAPKAEHEEYK